MFTSCGALQKAPGGTAMPPRVLLLLPLLTTLRAPAAARNLQPQQPKLSSFRPGQEWLDTDGAPIRAHSGGLLADPLSPGSYYWYGSDAYPDGNATLNRKINVYSSDDLYNWKHRGVAFSMPDVPICTAPAPSGEAMPCYADRCHVLYNAATRQYVMWCKAKPFVAVATSASAVGPFTLADIDGTGSGGVFLPAGHEVGDCTVYQDPLNLRVAYFALSIHPSSCALLPCHPTAVFPSL